MRLIDADIIINYLIDEGQHNGEKYGIKWGDNIKFSPREIAEIVSRTVPTVVAVPVVRCKDCKYYEGHYCWRQMKTYLARVSDTDYCSNGERRDNDDTNIDTAYRISEGGRKE